MKRQRKGIPCSAFTDYLSRRPEHLDEAIIRSMHPIDSGWIGHVSVGKFAGPGEMKKFEVKLPWTRWQRVLLWLVNCLQVLMGWIAPKRKTRTKEKWVSTAVEDTFDRFEQVYPDLRGPWEDVTAASCVGKPCDPDGKRRKRRKTSDGIPRDKNGYRIGP